MNFCEFCHEKSSGYRPNGFGISHKKLDTHRNLWYNNSNQQFR